MIRNRILSAVLLISLLPGCQTIRHINKGDQMADYKILQRSDERLVAELDNRLIIVATRMPQAPVVSAQVWVKTGSVFEGDYAGSGISHFLEHLLSGGSTSTRSEAESNRILGEIGAQKNAATGLDGVRYYINTISENTNTAIELLSDWIINPVFPEEEFLRERDVIQSEFSMGEGESGRIFWKLTQQALYSRHPARHPTIGYIDDFMKISREDIKNFYDKMYAPNNIVFSVSGDIDPEEVTRKIAALWRQVPERELPEISFPVEEKPINSPPIEGKADIRRPRVRLAWPAAELGSSDDYALDLLAVILGQGDYSRLNRRLRDAERSVSSVSAYNLSFYWGSGFFGVDAEPAPHNDGWEKALEKAREGVLREIRSIISEGGPSSEEIARAGRMILANAFSSNQSAQETAARSASDIISKGDPDYIFRYAKEIERVEREDILRAAEDILSRENMVEIRLLPLSEDEELKPLERETPQSEDHPVDFVNIDLDNRRPATLISQVSPVKRYIKTAGSAETHTLSNGIRVVLQPSHRVPSVSLHIYIKGGLLLDPKGSEGLGSAVASMLRRGSKNFSAEEFARALESIGASLGASNGLNTFYLRGEALSEDINKLLELTSEALIYPVFPESEWEIMRGRIEAALERETDSWYGELSKIFREEYFRDHPWQNTPLGKLEAVSGFKKSDLIKYHKNILRADDTVISMAGDILPEKIIPLLENLFGSIPAGRIGELPSVQAGNRGIIQRRTQKPVTAVKSGYAPFIPHNHPDYPAAYLITSLLSDFPSGWLQQTLRGEGPGLVYASWARPVTGLMPGYFEVSFNSTAERAPEAFRRSRETVARLKEGEIPDKDIQRSVAKVLFSESFSRQSNSERAAAAGLDVIYGTNDPLGERLLENIRRLTQKDIIEFAEEYLKESLTLILSDHEIDLDGVIE